MSLSDFGTNGYYLNYADSSDLGKDVSGKGNHWTSNNLAAEDQVPDSPTNNFSTMNAVDDSSMNYSEGNLRPTPASDYKATRGTIGIPTSGKWYFEARVITGGGGNVQDQMIGVATSSNVLTGTSPYPQSFTYGVGYFGSGKINRAGSTAQSSLTALAAGNILGVAVNVDDNEVQFYLNGSAVGTTEQLVSTSEPNFPMFVGATNRSSQFNFGQDSTFAGAISAGGNADANGNGDFAYAPPSNHLALCTSNLPNPAIDPNNEENPTDYFNTVLYTGDGQTSKNVTVGFEPDFTWVKGRSAGHHHSLIDSVRGDIALNANQAIAEYGVSPFNSNPNGTIDVPYYNNAYSMNTNSTTYVAWNWLGGGAASNNSNGTIQSSVSASTKSGFSIVSYTGNGGSSATVGHGLTSAPDCIWLKHRTAGEGWVSFWNTPAMGPTKFLGFNSTGGATTSSGEWNDTAPTNTVFTIGNQGRVNTNTATYIAYCFHNVDGHCRVGQYTGNGSSDGPVVHCGFRPAFILIKSTASGSDWSIYDNKRLGYNVDNNIMRIGSASSIPTEQTDDDIDILSNGFKFRRSSPNFNGSNTAFVFIAFAEQPFKYANAR